MNAVDRDVVSSVGSAVIAGLTMLVFCTAAGMQDETALQGAVLVGAVVSAANLARHGLLLAIERALGPIIDPTLTFYKENYFIQMNEAQYWMVVARDVMLGKENSKPRTTTVLRKIQTEEVE